MPVCDGSNTDPVIPEPKNIPPAGDATKAKSIGVASRHKA